MTDKKLSYGKYLQLDKLLNSQNLKSEEIGKEVHDEMLVQLDFFAGVLHSEDGAVEVWGLLPSIIILIITVKVIIILNQLNF